MKKRILSLFVLVAMLITMLPVSVYAAYPPEQKIDGTPNKAYGTVTTETNTGDMNMVPTNNPNPQKLGVGINPNIAIIDYNKDGYLDMMMGSGGLIYKGSYVFYGGPNSRVDNTFGKAHLVREHVFTYPSYTYDQNGDLKDQILFCSSTRFNEMPNNWNGPDMNNSAITWPKLPVGTCDYDDFTLADYNGDGYLDLVRGLSDWGDYGWHAKYTADGEWGDDNLDGVIDEKDDNISNDMRPTGVKDSDYYDNDPQHGWVMVCLNDGDTSKYASDGLPTKANFYGDAILIDAYDPENPETRGPVHTFGAPAPNFYDWDGDGDLDLMTGSFVDQIWYFENTGSATAPNYKAHNVKITGPKDENGNVIPTNFYAEGSCFKLEDGSDFYPDQQIVRPFVFDWNDDGNFDIVYTQEDGYARVAFGTGDFTEDKIPIVEEPVFFMQESDMLKSGAFLTTFAIDWDHDGDEDLFNGDSSGYISFIENITPAGGDLTDPIWAEPVHICDTTGKEIRIMAGMNGSIQGASERKWGYTTFSMADWDGDGDIDIVANNIWGKILWIENLNESGKYELKFSDYQRVEVNDETPDKPAWNWWTPEPYELVTQWRTCPVAMDANGDGLCDIVMLDYEGYLSIFYRRTDGRVEPGAHHMYDINGNPLRLNNNVRGSSGRTKICFADWDADGDLDLIMNDTVNVSWLENVPTDDMPFRFNSAQSLHSRQLVLHSTSPTACDWNKDGKPDLIVGAEDGHFYYLENNFVAKPDYTPLDKNLVAHWDFENTGAEDSELLDKAVYGNSFDDLKADDSVIIKDGVATIPASYAGTHWNQLKNVSEPDYAITAGNGADVNLTGPMTVYARIKLGSGTITSGNIFAALLDKRDMWGGKRSYALGFYKLGDNDYGVAGIVGSTTKTSTVRIPRDQWREIVAVYKPNESGNIQLEIFVSTGEKADNKNDFVSVLDVDTGAQMTSAGATELLIGRCVDNLALGADLSIDDIRIYDTELNVDQLSRIDLGQRDVGHYYVKQGATGDGRSVNNPAPSVEEALKAVSKDLPDPNDFAYVYIMQHATCPDDNIGKVTTGANYATISMAPYIIRERTGENYSVISPEAEHKATVCITSWDNYGTGVMNYLAYSNFIGANSSLRIAGPTIFKNIALVRNISGQAREIITRGNKVEFDNVKFYSTDANCFSGAPYTKLVESNPVFWTMDATTAMEGPAEIHLNSAFTQDKYHHISIPGGAGHNVAANAFYPITYYINNEDINGNILWGPNDNNASDGADAGYVHDGINVVINAAGELKNADPMFCGTLNISGGLQIVNNNGETFPELPSNVTADKIWILNSEKNGANSLDVTTKKGTFKVLGGNIAFAQSSDRSTIYYSDRYLELPADEYTVKYVSDVSEIADKALFPASSQEGKVFDRWQDNGDGTMTAIFRDGYLELSYYVLAGGTGDGRSPQNPAGSVESVVASINADLPNSFNIAHVYIMQKPDAVTLENGAYAQTVSNFTPWITGRTAPQEGWGTPNNSHKAKIIVSSYNYETTGVKNYLIFSDYIGAMHHLRLMGPTEFKNIILLGNRIPSTIVARGYSVSFENTEFMVSNANGFSATSQHTTIHNGFVAFWGIDGTGTNATGSQVIALNSAIPVINTDNPNVFVVGDLQSGTFPSSIDRNITYRFNNSSFQAQLSWGGPAVANTVLTKGLNIVVDAAASFEVLKTPNPVTITGGLQIVNNNGTKFSDVPSNVTADKTWIVNSANGAGGTLDVTDTAGTFAIVGKKFAYTEYKAGTPVYFGTETITLPAGEYNIGYADSIDEIKAKLGTVPDTADGLVFSSWEVSGNTITPTFAAHVPVQKNYYVLAGGTGDGRTAQTPAGSVEAVVASINADLPYKNDTAYVYIMQKTGEGDLDAGKKAAEKSNYTPWIVDRTSANEATGYPKYYHNAKMIVSSYNYETTGVKNNLIFSDFLGSMHHLRLMGPTEFKDIVLLGNRVPSTIVARGYSVSFENVDFKASHSNGFSAGSAYNGIYNGYVAFWGIDGTGTQATDSQVITLNSAIPAINTDNPNVFIVGDLQSGTFPASIDRNVTYRFNNSAFQAQLSWGGPGAANTVLTKGLNIVVDNIASFEVAKTPNPVNITGGLQIVNNRGLRFPEIPSNVTADKTWIINSEKRSAAAIDITETPGTFKVLGGGIATATPVGGGESVTSDDILVLEPGEYNVTYTNVPFSYYVLAGGTGDGRTPQTPAGSVEALVPVINADLPNATDTAYVYIMQKENAEQLEIGAYAQTKSNFTPWIAGRTGANEANARPTVFHKAKMIVSSYNYEETGEKNHLIFSDYIGGMHPLRLMGPTEFKDIILLGNFIPSAVVARGYSVKFDNIEFKVSNANGFNAASQHTTMHNGYVAFADMDGSATNATEDQVITINAAFPVINETAANFFISGHNQFGNVGTLGRKITYRFNNPAFRVQFAIGGSITNLTNGLNIVADKAASFELHTLYNPVNVTGGLQIINNNGLKFPDVSEIINADKTWIVNSGNDTNAKVDITDTTGTFDITVSGGKTPVAVDKEGKVYTATKTDDIITSGNLTPKTNYKTNDYEDYIWYRRPLTNTYKKLTEDKQLNILYFGGSLTAGYGVNDKATYSWRGMTDKWFTENFPDATITPVDRTLGETGTYLGAYRLDDDILNPEKTPAPDLMFLEYSANDMVNDNVTEAEHPYYAGLQCETIIREVKERYPECDIVIVYTGSIKTIEDHRNGKLHPTAVAHDVIAKAYDIPAVLPGPMLSNILKGSNLVEWTEDFMSNYNYNRDGAHLNEAGNAEYFKVVKEYLNNALLCTEHGEETVYTEIPAVVSDYLLDGERTVHAMTQELIDKSEALGGHGFYEKDQWTYYVYDTVAATTSNTSKFVFEFTGTGVDIVTNFRNEHRIGAKLIVSLDGAEPREVQVTDCAPMVLFKGLEPTKHTVEITPSVFPTTGLTEFHLQLLMTYDETKHTKKGTPGNAAVAKYSITLPEGEYDMYYLDGSTVGELPFSPANDSQILTGWSDGTSVLEEDAALVPGSIYTPATQDISSYLEFAGVQIRLATGKYKQGLRFVADKKNALASDKFGMVLIPSEFIGDSRTISEYSSQGGNSTNNIVGADKLFIGSTHEYNGKTYSSANVVAEKIFSEYEDGVMYTTCLTGIEEKDYATYYTAKAYVVYTFGGKEYVAYSEPFRSSIYEVARFALDTDDDLDATTETYLQSLVQIAEQPKVAAIKAGFSRAINTYPELHSYEEFNPTGEFEGITAGWFDGMDRSGQKTKVFAYLGFPEGASAESPVPAVVLMHGGGGHAFLQWVKLWNDRGYAAIAIDNTGWFPAELNAGATETHNGWTHGIPNALAEAGYTSTPSNDGMSTSSGDVSEMWMYHAVGESILAHNILRADARVDSDKIGITGISWGGVITSISIGYDTRYAFAIPIYGSGYLDESFGWIKDNFSDDDTKELWLAQDHFDKVDMPVLWMAWNDDIPFSINSNSKSFVDTIENNNDTRLTIRNEMRHSHQAGWAQPESYIFADSVVSGGTKLTAFSTQPYGRSINISANVSSGATIASATAYYITEKMSYSGSGQDVSMDQDWKTYQLNVDGTEITGQLPDESKGYYIEVVTLIDGESTVTTSAYAELD